MSYSTPPTTTENFEIDIIKFIIELWKEKITITLATFALFLISTTYAFNSTPIYSISAQITPPTEADIARFKINTKVSGGFNGLSAPSQEGVQQMLVQINNPKTDTSNIISKEEAFSLFLSKLDSNAHITKLTNTNTKDIELATGLIVDDNIIQNIKALRKILIPNTIQKQNILAPDSYTLSITGINREALKVITAKDLELASQSTTEEIKSLIIAKINQLISEKTSNQNQKRNTLINYINARKSYLLAQKNDKIRELSDAHRIATQLGIDLPTSISQFSSKATKIEVSAELSNTPPPLYLRGASFLKAELENLQQNKILADEDLRLMEAQLFLLQENTLVESLEKELESIKTYTGYINFFAENFNIPSTPIKPQKVKIAATGIFLGIILGLILASIKITRRKILTT